jgi:hypothetical protein
LLNKLLDGFEGKLTTSKWAKIAKCSQDTALRDIQDLIEKKVLAKEMQEAEAPAICLQFERNAQACPDRIISLSFCPPYGKRHLLQRKEKG